MPNTKIKYEAGLGGATHERGKSFIDAAELILNHLSLAQIEEIKKIPKENLPLAKILSPNKNNKDNYQLLKDYINALRDYWQKLDPNNLAPKDLAALERTLIEAIGENVYYNNPLSFKKVKDELDDAENHVNWKKRDIKETTTNTQGMSISRAETPISKFSSELTKEWLKITHKHKPRWFLALPKWEQHYFIQRLEEWKNQALKQRTNLGDFLGSVPTTIRRYPGAANAYITSVEIKKDDGTSLNFHKIRAGVIAPNKMKAGNKKDRAEKVHITKQNLEQLVAIAIQEKIKEIKANGLDITHPIDLPILFQTLYSPPFQPPGAYNNASTMKAIDKLRKELDNPAAFIKKHKIDCKVEGQNIQFSNIQLLYSNRPVNNARGLTWFINLFTRQGSESRTSVKELTKYVEKLTGTNRAICAGALKSYQEMPYIFNTLSSLIPPSKNNALAEKAALEQIIASKVGARIGTCVSGKDREEMITEIAIAQQAFFLKYDQFPPFSNVGGKDKALRAEFVEMVARQYLTGHGHALAAENSKGCDGLKNIVDVFGKDICSKIQALAPESGIDPEKFDPIKSVQRVAGLNKLNVKKLTLKIDNFLAKFKQSISFNIFKQDKQALHNIPTVLNNPDTQAATLSISQGATFGVTTPFVSNTSEPTDLDATAKPHERTKKPKMDK